MTTTSRLRPSIALAAYAEPLIDARRVLVCGDATSSLAEHLVSRGARSVHVFDTDQARVAEATTKNSIRNVSFATLNEEGLALRDGAFDVAIIENLAAVGDVAFVLKAIRRVLSARGAALVACANPDVDVPLVASPNVPKISIDYYSLYDAVAEEFEHVRMLGQTPFVGYAIADFAPEGDPLPSLDTGFVPGGAEEPECFVALASQEPVVLDEFAVIQLPFASTWQHQKSDETEERLKAARASERRSRERAATLEAENQRLTRSASSRDDAEQTERMKKELARRDDWIRELEGRCTAADARADHAESELEAEREKSLDVRFPERAELEGSIQELTERLKAAHEQQAASDHAVADYEAELSRLRAREAELEERLDAGDPETQKEVEKLERQLKERGQEVLRLSQELKKLEQLSRNLVRELAEVREAGGRPDAAEVAALREKLDALALKNASREADLVALHWTVSSLEGKLEALSPQVPSASAQ